MATKGTGKAAKKTAKPAAKKTAVKTRAPKKTAAAKKAAPAKRADKPLVIQSSSKYEQAGAPWWKRVAPRLPR